MLKKCHFIGIGGIGMSGLARLLINKNYVVSGSDISSTRITDSLSREGAKVYVGHAAANIEQGTTVIYSTDIKKDNPEYAAAIQLKCPMMHRSELLKKLMEDYESLTVAGTHGKTTTSSLLAWVLESCGESPTYAIGGVVPQLQMNSGQGEGKHFVAEACESDGTFLNYAPNGAIVTNIDFDHMDFYHNEQALLDAFKEFMEKVTNSKRLFWCGDDPYLKKLQPKGISYGFSNNCELKASNYRQNEWMLSMDVSFNGKVFKDVEASLIGRHNSKNALAVFGLCLSLGLDEKDVRKGLRTFGGVLRRCEKKGEAHGILFIDDYAHHPTELKATLSAIRQAVGARRLVVAYQPHRYTRTRDCIGMYGGVFSEADDLFITEIYSARETPIQCISHETVINEVKNELKDRCRYNSRESIADKLASFLRPHDVLVTLGAGDITQLSGEVMEKLSQKAPAKLKLGLIFGGASVEHEVSLISSANIHDALNHAYYDVEQFGITNRGSWLHGNQARKQLESKEIADCSAKISPETLKELLHCDILFPVLHGTYGEDGTIQGFFDIFSKAYVGCDHRSSSISMDKAMSKRLARDAGLPILPFISFTRFRWDTEQDDVIREISQELTYPVFVKPVHLGSSIGVHKVANFSSLEGAIAAAFNYDDCLIVENGLENMREIEFSVLGNENPLVFPPGEVYANGKIHDFDSKYGLNPQKAAAEFAVAAKLSEEKINEGIALAKAVYQTIGCSGMARVDTFLDANGSFWFNEINPIPGFTKYSLYPLMCQANGLPLGQLIDRLVVLGMQRRRRLDRLEVTK